MVVVWDGRRSRPSSFPGAVAVGFVELTAVKSKNRCVLNRGYFLQCRKTMCAVICLAVKRGARLAGRHGKTRWHGYLGLSL